MKEWALQVERSTRQLQGLERGEPVGEKTLQRVALTLGRELSVLIDLLAETEELSSVSPADDDGDFGTIKARKPANMSDEDFKRLLTEYQEEIEWKLDRAARER